MGNGAGDVLDFGFLIVLLFFSFWFSLLVSAFDCFTVALIFYLCLLILGVCGYTSTSGADLTLIELNGTFSTISRIVTDPGSRFSLLHAAYPYKRFFHSLSQSIGKTR